MEIDMTNQTKILNLISEVLATNLSSLEDAACEQADGRVTEEVDLYAVLFSLQGVLDTVRKMRDGDVNEAAEIKYLSTLAICDGARREREYA
jgi:hypothetical protein